MIPHSQTYPQRTKVSEAGRNKLRLAIGLFGSLADALATARDLVGSGIATGRICLAATPDAKADAMAETSTIATAAQSDAARSFGCFRYTPEAGGLRFEPNGTPADPVAQDMRLVAKALSEHLNLPALRHQRLQLRSHLDGRGWLLVVRLADLSEQHAVCTILLRRARFGVQTHEIRCP